MMQTLSGIVFWLARFMALLGGIVLVALILMTTASIAGRAMSSIGLAPVPGDFELVEAGMAFAVFTFLPWCQLQRGHASVEIFSRLFGSRSNAVLDLISDLLMFLVALLITWQLGLGMLDKKSYFETTFILQLPIWWGYATALAGACVFSLVAFFCLLRSLGVVTQPDQDHS